MQRKWEQALRPLGSKLTFGTSSRHPPLKRNRPSPWNHAHSRGRAIDPVLRWKMLSPHATSSYDRFSKREAASK